MWGDCPFNTVDCLTLQVLLTKTNNWQFLTNMLASEAPRLRFGASLARIFVSWICSELPIILSSLVGFAMFVPNLPYSKSVGSTVAALPIGGPCIVEIPEDQKLGAAKTFHSFHPWLYTCVVRAADPNWFYASIFHCAELYTIQGHRRWKSPHTPAL